MNLIRKILSLLILSYARNVKKNIGLIEGYYTQDVLEKLRKGNYPKEQKDDKGNEIAELSKVHLEIVLLLVYSIFFRCSITAYHGFKLGNLEEKIRRVLVNYLDDSVEKIIDRVKIKPHNFLYLPIINTFFKQDNNEDTTKNFVTVLHSKIPFFVYLNEVTFQLFEKEKHVGASAEHFYGIKEMISQKKSVNKKGENFKVIVLNQQQLSKVLLNAFGDVASRQLAFQRRAFREIHKRIFGKKANEELTNYYIQMLIQNEVPEGEKYSMKTVANVMYETLVTAYQLPRG